MPFYTLQVRLQFFYQIKDRIMIHNRGNFHQYSIFGCQVSKFESFPYLLSIDEMVLLGVLLNPNSPNIVGI